MKLHVGLGSKAIFVNRSLIFKKKKNLLNVSVFPSQLITPGEKLQLGKGKPYFYYPDLFPIPRVALSPCAGGLWVLRVF